MNCTELDLVIRDVHALVVQDDAAFGVAVGFLMILSLLLLGGGEKLVRPLSALVGGLAGAVGAFWATSLFDEKMECMARLITSAVAGVLCAVLALCIFKTGLFVLGAGAFATATHFVYDVLPLDGIKPPFVLAGRSGYYYIAMTPWRSPWAPSYPSSKRLGLSASAAPWSEPVELRYHRTSSPNAPDRRLETWYCWESWWCAPSSESPASTIWSDTANGESAVLIVGDGVMPTIPTRMGFPLEDRSSDSPPEEQVVLLRDPFLVCIFVLILCRWRLGFSSDLTLS